MSYQAIYTKLSAALASRGVRHFSAKELLFTGSSNQDPDSPGYGLNELLPEMFLGNMVNAATHAEAFREAYGGPLKVISAYRSPKYNRTLAGAADHSLHMQGKAIDLVPGHGGVTGMHGCAEWLWKSGEITGGMGIYPWGVHLDCGRRRRW